jgi:hypothetical protein
MGLSMPFVNDKRLFVTSWMSYYFIEYFFRWWWNQTKTNDLKKDIADLVVVWHPTVV